MWRKILKYLPQAKEFHRKEIKSGMHSSFWFDSWCSLGWLHDILGDLGYIDLGIMASAIIAEALATHGRRCHRMEPLNLVDTELESLELMVLLTVRTYHYGVAKEENLHRNSLHRIHGIKCEK